MGEYRHVLGEGYLAVECVIKQWITPRYNRSGLLDHVFMYMLVTTTFL
jgi:hypothetical protein